VGGHGLDVRLDTGAPLQSLPAIVNAVLICFSPLCFQHYICKAAEGGAPNLPLKQHYGLP
jgi:hypothetical protein